MSTRLGATDMRKTIDGLSILVSWQLQSDPFAGLPIFKRRDSPGGRAGLDKLIAIY